jgi:hypothetical protein
MRHLIQREFIVDVPLSIAWNHLAQVEQWPTWAKHIKAVELKPKGELTIATVGSFRLANGINSDFRMTNLNPQRNWQWVGPFLWLTVYYDHQFVPVDEWRTKLIWIVAAEGVGVALFGRVFAMIYNRNLDQAIPNLIAELHTRKA